MSMRRLILLGLGAFALIAIVALAARGGALHSGSGRGSGPSAAFWNYGVTTGILIAAAFTGAVIYAFLGVRSAKGKVNQRPYSDTLWALFGFLVMGFALRFVLYGLLHRHGHNLLKLRVGGVGQSMSVPPPKHVPQGSVRIQWPEVAIVIGAVLLLMAAGYVRRTRRGLPALPRRSQAESLAEALDLSLDDLRADPDLRRAIIAAYARMERALAAAGTARRPSETALEYLERVLLSLEASAEAVRRLTDLFQWARFSHHAPEPSMRDEAVDALAAVRDELRSAELVAA